MIIGISGRMGSGKNTVGDIIEKICLTNEGPVFEQRSFAGKLKQIASLLTGIDVEKFEDQEFKKSLLGDEWGTVKENPLNSIPVFEDVQFNHLMSVRELLQKLGTEAMRDGLHENVWVNALFADYKAKWVPTGDAIEEDEVSLEKEYPNWIITDMRFPNELEAIELREGVTIRVVRPDMHSLQAMVPTHASETALDDATFDYEIINDGTIEDLIEKVKEILIKENII
jgi:hypothetical protein